jgi:Flp pilus assembly protein TadG
MRLLRRVLSAGRRAAAAFAIRQDGGPASEFALVAPIFIVVIFATVQCAIIYIANAYLETGAEAAARTVLTNNAVVTATSGSTTAMTAAQFQAAVCAKLPPMFNCNGVMVSLQAATSPGAITIFQPTFDANGALTNPLPYQLPAQGQYGVFEVLYAWPVIGLPLGWNFGKYGSNYMLQSTQVFKVENNSSSVQ